MPASSGSVNGAPKNKFLMLTCEFYESRDHISQRPGDCQCLFAA
jgi:hypothetical protein